MHQRPGGGYYTSSRSHSYARNPPGEGASRSAGNPPREGASRSTSRCPRSTHIPRGWREMYSIQASAVPSVSASSQARWSSNPFASWLQPPSGDLSAVSLWNGW